MVPRTSIIAAVLLVFALCQPCPAQQAAADKAKPANAIILQEGLAAWYGKNLHGKKTASGELFDMNELTAAHRTLPFGTRVRVTNLDNGKSVEVRVNDRGPYDPKRVIDLSLAAAKVLGFAEKGMARVMVAPIKEGADLPAASASIDDDALPESARQPAGVVAEPKVPAPAQPAPPKATPDPASMTAKKPTTPKEPSVPAMPEAPTSPEVPAQPEAKAAPQAEAPVIQKPGQKTDQKAESTPAPSAENNAEAEPESAPDAGPENVAAEPKSKMAEQDLSELPLVPAGSVVYVQVGAFSDANAAEQLKQAIADEGYSARIEIVRSGETILHKVQAGPYVEPEAARDAKQDLARDYRGAFYVTVPAS